MKRVKEMANGGNVFDRALKLAKKMNTAFLASVIVVSNVSTPVYAEDGQGFITDEGVDYEGIREFAEKKKEERDIIGEATSKNSDSVITNGSVDFGKIKKYADNVSEYVDLKQTMKDNDGYVVDINALYNKFANGELTKLSDYESLYDICDEGELKDTLSFYKKNLDGRDTAVSTALYLISEASKKGYSMDYDWGGGHHEGSVTLDDLATGVDCSGFVSYLVDCGTSETFASTTTYGLIGVGTDEDFGTAKSGDILVNADTHVTFIVDNDANNQEFLVAEASCDDVGIVLSKVPYCAASGYYSCRDMDSVYHK